MSQEKRFVPNKAFIDELNSAQSLWKAKHYKEYEGMTVAEMMKRAGGKAKMSIQRFVGTASFSF